jgi:hypothetical protein
MTPKSDPLNVKWALPLFLDVLKFASTPAIARAIIGVETNLEERQLHLAFGGSDLGAIVGVTLKAGPECLE